MGFPGTFRRPRRGAVAVLTAFALTVILGMAALAIDMSWLVSARDQLQGGVDDSAISAAYYIANYDPFPITNAERIALSTKANKYGEKFMLENPVETQALHGSNVQTGQVTRNANGRVTGFTANSSNFNAIRVFTSMSGNNPELPAFLGTYYGVQSYRPEAQAIALVRSNPGVLLPFTIRKEIWDAYLTPPQSSTFENNQISDQDNYTWNPIDWSVSNAQGDGIPEIKLYPHKNGGCGGNFGTLNIDITNQGTPFLGAQIENGVTTNEIDDELSDDGWGGPFAPVFGTYPWPYPTAVPTHYFSKATTNPMGITGNPGISGGLEPYVETRIGTLVGIFIHTSCTGGGSNVVYTIAELRFARLLAVDLSAKYIWIQPTTEVPNLNQLNDHGFYEVLGLGR